MTYYLRTHVGHVRKSNEDSCFAAEKDGCLFAVVADGMGGHNGGEVASQIVVEKAKRFLDDNMTAAITPESIIVLLSDCNKCVWEQALRNKALQGMGSTATLVLVRGNNALIGHVGDSRAYLYRSGKLEQLTKDHSYVQMLIDNGYISKEEALHHPYRNIITRAIGSESGIEVDTLTIGLLPGDVLLLCSDGLNNAVPDDKIAAILKDGIEAAADKLIDAALVGGGLDNVTVVIAEMDGAGL